MAVLKKPDLETLNSKTQEVFRRLRKHHPDATIELTFKSPLELLIATILSAQCTDVKVNEVTPKLFAKFKRPQDYVRRPVTEIEEIIKPTGFFRNKAKNIRGAVAKILAEYDGQVPRKMEELITLPGVGRKTANVILGNAFNTPGLPVDTHVTRLVNRIGLTWQTDAVKIEHELCAMLPKKNWTMFSHTLIFHGRRICNARKPACSICPITDLCDYFQENFKDGRAT